MLTNKGNAAVRRLVYVASLIVGAAVPRLAVAQSSFELELMHLARQSEIYGRLQEAERLYSQVIAGNPASQTAHHRLGVLAARNKDYDQAIAYFTTAECTGPPSPRLLNDFGAALYLKGNLARAEQKLRAALTIEPQNKEAHSNLELVQAQQAVQAEARARAIAEAERTARDRLVADEHATAETMDRVRMTARAREIAEARAMAESRAAAKAMADARAAKRLREIAQARARYETGVAAVAYNQPMANADIVTRPNTSRAMNILKEPVQPLQVGSRDRAPSRIAGFWSWCSSLSRPWRDRTVARPVQEVPAQNTILKQRPLQALPVHLGQQPTQALPVQALSPTNATERPPQALPEQDQRGARLPAVEGSRNPSHEMAHPVYW